MSKVPYCYIDGKLRWHECHRACINCLDCKKNKVHIAPYENILIDYQNYEKHKCILDYYVYYRLLHKDVRAVLAHKAYYMYWCDNYGKAYLVKNRNLREQLYQNLYPILRRRGIFPQCTIYNLDYCICL